MNQPTSVVSTDLLVSKPFDLITESEPRSFWDVKLPTNGETDNEKHQIIPLLGWHLFMCYSSFREVLGV